MVVWLDCCAKHLEQGQVQAPARCGLEPWKAIAGMHGTDSVLHSASQSDCEGQILMRSGTRLQES